MEHFNEADFKGNPNVYKVDWFKLVLTYSFRVKLFQTWKERGTAGVIEEMKAADLGPEKVRISHVKAIILGFTNSGFPFCRQNELLLMGEEKNPLLLSGKFIRMEKGIGLKLEPGFEEILFAQYPDISVEEGLQKAGLDLRDVGCFRINRIQKAFKERADKLYATDPTDQGCLHMVGLNTDSDDTGTEAQKEKEIAEHPYVLRVIDRKVLLTANFYNEAKPFEDIGISEILKIFEIPADWLDTENRIEIGSKLRRWERTEPQLKNRDGQELQILWNQEQAMTGLVAKYFTQFRRQLAELSMEQKRKLCRMIRDLPRDPWGFYTVRRILEKIGMSKSTYYEFLSNENYGRSAERKARKDAEDILLVRQVVAYKGYQKGYRQVYMMMESVTGQRMSIHRVLYLMRLDGIRTTIRRPSKNRKAMREVMQRNGHPNLLDRRFTQYRPNKVRLTDVTYLDYGNGQRAYGSASIDPVTGRLICFVVNENNDLQLALDTLDAMDAYPAEKGGIIHSDQGILYFTDDYQNAIRERNLIQSMSRRGNCWDNAPQESFFGHFKDECRYGDCKSLDELRCAVQEYGVYFNQDRRMWNRKHMTPVEYEAYLIAMTDEEFAVYLAEEEAAWKERKAKSAEKAAERARSYRESVKEAQEDLQHGAGECGDHVQV